MASRIAKDGDSVILYDAALCSQPAPPWFDERSWPDAATAPGYSGGRGRTLFIEIDGRTCVLRHYCRGGLIGRLLADQFPWLGQERTRSFREWRLLQRLQVLRLPAPTPVACRYVRRGPFYTADLITLRLPGVEPFSRRLARGPAARSLWRAVGECVGRFHASGIYHADLTAHNLQVDPAGAVFLLDFDRGGERPGTAGWQRRNLDRLQRSLRKIRRHDGAAFADADWQELLAGYAAITTRAR